jgi:hypothetical protein
VAVDDQDFLEPVVGDALGDVQTEGDEGVRLNVDGAGEVDVVHVQAVGNRRQHQDPVGSAPAHLETNGLAQEQIDIQRQVPTVLFRRAGGQDDQLLGGDGVVHFGPGETVVAILQRSAHDHPFYGFASRRLSA